MPLHYHAGQLAVQAEANTRILADRMANWVGPAADFALGADLLLFSHLTPVGDISFIAVFGPPPLVETAGSGYLRIPAAVGVLPTGPVGGLAINLSQARRVRLNGVVESAPDGPELNLAEVFTLCRKYLAPSIGIGEATHTGPGARVAVAADEPALIRLVAGTETMFLATVAPDGAPDVAYRGGPVGFLAYDAVSHANAWSEFIGDGVFKSAGTLRATNRFTVLIPDLETGDAYELVGHGDYENERVLRREREDPLEQHRDPYPPQGRVTGTVERVLRLSGFMRPRGHLDATIKVTSNSHVDLQAPQ